MDHHTCKNNRIIENLRRNEYELTKPHVETWPMNLDFYISFWKHNIEKCNGIIREVNGLSKITSYSKQEWIESEQRKIVSSNTLLTILRSFKGVRE